MKVFQTLEQIFFSFFEPAPDIKFFWWYFWGADFWANFAARYHLQSDFPNRVKIF